MRKVKSMHDLNRNKKTEHQIPIEFESASPSKVSEKIDQFLLTVSQQQEALSKILQERKMGRPSVVSRMSSVMSTKSPGPLRAKPPGPFPKKSPAAAKSFSSRRQEAFHRAKSTSLDVKSSIDTSKVTSKLKKDRNYQPPRRRQWQMQPQKSGSSSQQKRLELKRQGQVHNEEDYGDDFEEDDDEDTDQLAAKQKEAWLYDQAIRGQARQKAAEALKIHKQQQKKFFQEKESSKDSAYGFSGGENSRLHTREPTPDTNNQALNHRLHSRGGPPPPVCQNPSLRKQFSATFANHQRWPRTAPTRQASSNSKACNNHIVDASDTSKVDFLHQVTQEILSRGHFTEKAIKRALESHLNNQNSYNLSHSEKSDLVNKLKENFGLLDTAKSSFKRPLFKMSKASPALGQRSTGSESSSEVRVAKKSPKIIDFDDDLSSICKDESDSDIVQIVKAALRTKKDEPDRPRAKAPVAAKHPAAAITGGGLFNSLNLTHLNVSLNSSNMQEAKRRLEENRTQALLVKSFAAKTDDIDKESQKESSDAEDDQPGQLSERSSHLYQSDEEDLEEERSSAPASIVDDEELPQP